MTDNTDDDDNADDNIEDFELAKVRVRLRESGLKEGEDFTTVGTNAEIIGPFRGGIYKLASFGYLIPHVYLYKRSDTDYDWTIVLDSRFELDANEEEILRWSWLLGNSMAIAAGYSCFGENCRPTNKYMVRISPI